MAHGLETGANIGGQETSANIGGLETGANIRGLETGAIFETTHHCRDELYPAS